MQISFSVRIILKEVLSLRSCISDLCLISEGWATALLQLHNINPYNTGLLWQLMSLNSLYSKDLVQNCQVVQFNAAQSFAPVELGEGHAGTEEFTQTLRGGIWALQLRAFLTSKLCTASPEAFQPLAEVSKLSLAAAMLSSRGCLRNVVHIQFHLLVFKDEITKR